MANVSHASLTGSNLHEPKGVAAAAIGTVYVANGSGSGTWTDVGTASFTGMIADFITPVAPTGWLECDGTVISTSTFNSLYNVMTIHTSGTRSSGSPIITSIASTATLRVGYFVFGAGIGTGSTILSIDSATQITISNNASSAGTASFDVSPWLLNTGTIKLPDLTTAGRFRRSRTSATKVGDIQASQNISHNHTGTITSTINSNDHTHSYSGNTGTQSANHTHNFTGFIGGAVNAGGGVGGDIGGTFTTTTESGTHTHAYSGTTGNISANHTHNTTIPSDGGTEARPVALIVMTCVKT